MSKTKTIKVRDISGQYVKVALDEIFRASAEAIDQRFKPGQAFTNHETAKTYFREKLAGREREVFAAIFLDTRHKLIAYEELFFGTVDGAEVHPRVVAQRALMHNAAAIIVSHNHPSGNPDPSAADRAVTAQLKQALSLLDVRLLDHIVVAGSSCVSLAAQGWV